jgi:hypothetical protein
MKNENKGSHELHELHELHQMEKGAERRDGACPEQREG